MEPIPKNKFYAGIGSRETPLDILIHMMSIGLELQNLGWTLRSGAASGADTAFENGALLAADAVPNTEIYLPWHGYNDHTSMLHPNLYPFTREEERISAYFHPAWGSCKQGAQRLHMRNLRIMLGLNQENPVQFVVCWTQNGKIRGGTGQALRIAQHFKIPVFNLGAARNEDQLKEIIDSIEPLLKDLAHV